MVRAWVWMAAVAAMAMPGAGAKELVPGFQGIRYTEEGRPVGMPMGGVGAGCIEITSQGTLAEFANVNNWAARIPSIPGTGLWVTLTEAGKTRAFPLAGRRVRFEGNFPFAKLTFPDLPVKLTLWAWSPFVLHDIRRSGYPAALFDAEAANPGRGPVEVGLALAYGTDKSAARSLFFPSEVAREVPFAVRSAGAPFRRGAASGIRFSTTTEMDASAVEALARARRGPLEDAYLRPYTYTPLDMRAACNRSYLRQPFGSDPGNAPLNFGDVRPGRRLAYGIPFEVLDDAAANGKSFVMAGPEESEKSVRIPVGQRADCLFFYGNCAGWANNGTASYVVRYADGTEQAVPLRPGQEISDWFGGAIAYSPAQVVGKREGGSYVINVFAVPTDGTKEIAAIEVRKMGRMSPIVFAVTLGRLSQTPMAEGIVAMRRADIGRMVGNFDAAKLAPNTDAEYALAARALKGARVLTHSVPGPDAVGPALEGRGPATAGQATVYAVEQRVRLAPGGAGRLGLVCAWYAPNHRTLNGHRFGHKYEEWFPDAPGAAEEVARDHDSLLRDTLRGYNLIATSTLPKWYREMLQSNFYLMPAGTWLTKDGTAFTYETPNGCPLFGTMDVRYYGSFTKLAGFPELDARVLRQFAAVQHPDGFIQHDLGGSSGLVDSYAFPPNPPPAPVAPRKNRHDYDGYWVNLPIKYCLQVARHYQWTGDRAFLKEMWPHVKRAIVWIEGQDEDADGLPETNYGYDGWKMVDKCNYDANQWLAMLVAVARLARDLGEPEYAGQLMETHAKALAQVEKLLWTGRYFRQAVHNDTGNNDMVSLLQLAGDWYADILGFESGLPREQVRSAMRAMDEVLGKDAMYGLTDCLHPDGSRSDSWICNGQAIGWQYFYASHCMYEGLDDIALRVADEAWRQFTVERARVPWCQEEFVGEPPKGECPYWLLRDMRMGSTMVMAYAAAGLRLDVPAGTASIRPAKWVWKDARCVLPVLLPTWLGQIRYERGARGETYTLTNLEKPFALRSLRLRTGQSGTVVAHVAGARYTRRVDAALVDVGPVTLGAKPLVVRLAARN